MPTVLPKPPALPSREDVDLADYKLGSFGSDLDMIRSQLEDCAGPTITVEEYLRRVEAGEELPEPPAYDRDEVARLVLFATDAVEDLERFKKDAERVSSIARALFHEQAYDAEAHKALLRRWHEAELGEKGGGDA